MKAADRLRLLQQRYAAMRLQDMRPPTPANAPTVVSIGGAQAQLPPIRIELAVKAQNDPNVEQRVVNRTAPYPG